MKKNLLLVLFTVGISSLSFSQSAGKGGSEKSGGGFFHRLFHKEQSPHAQMKHFEKQKKDPKMKNNGTSYRRNKKSSYNVDGDDGRRRRRN
jgi:hypothetical protein